MKRDFLMSTPIRSNASSLVTALNPADFSEPDVTSDGPAPDLGSSAPASSPGSLDANDRIALQALLGVLRNARVAAQSSDEATAQNGKWQMLSAICYLSGFLDSKGLLEAAPVNAGFEHLTQNQFFSGSADNTAHHIEEILVKMISVPDTRGPFFAALTGGFAAVVIKSGYDDIMKGLTP
jgi:hypothetical protein